MISAASGEAIARGGQRCRQDRSAMPTQASYRLAGAHFSHPHNAVRVADGDRLSIGTQGNRTHFTAIRDFVQASSGARIPDGRPAVGTAGRQSPTVPAQFHGAYSTLVTVKHPDAVSGPCIPDPGATIARTRGGDSPVFADRSAPDFANVSRQQLRRLGPVGPPHPDAARRATGH
jgi:hypothetical protein